MNKITHLKLINHKALKMCKLEKLGKINIICGKNNSGKTTLLEAIENSEKCLIAKKWDQDEVTVLSKAWENSVRVVREVHASNMIYYLNQLIKNAGNISNIVGKTLTDLQFSYADEIDRFAETFHDNLIQLINSRVPSNSQATITIEINNNKVREKFVETYVSMFRQFYLQQFKESENKQFVYVKPKRNISDKKAGNTKDVSSEGLGLLRELHSLKNDLPGHHNRSFYENLEHAFTEVSSGFKFTIPNPSEESMWELYFSEFDKSEWRSADNWGLGLQDLLVILYFALIPEKQFLLIEEPENHLHPELQRRLLRFLKEETPDEKQFILTTHSNIFLDNTYVDRVFHTKIENGELTVNDTTSSAKIMDDLGYSTIDNLTSDLIIIVEGIYDKRAISEFLRKMEMYGNYNIKFWILGGDLMDHVDLEGFAGIFNIIVLLDRDDKSDRKNFLNQCKELRIPVTKLKKYSMENYFPLRVYQECFGDKISKRITSLDDNKPIWEQLGGIRKKDIKKGNEKFARKTELDEIKGTDLWKFLKKAENILLGESPI